MKQSKIKICSCKDSKIKRGLEREKFTNQRAHLSSRASFWKWSIHGLRSLVFPALGFVESSILFLFENKKGERWEERRSRGRLLKWD